MPSVDLDPRLRGGTLFGASTSAVPFELVGGAAYRSRQARTDRSHRGGEYGDSVCRLCLRRIPPEAVVEGPTLFFEGAEGEGAGGAGVFEGVVVAEA